MINTGKYNHLRISRRTTHGAYLFDDEGNEVLLPNKYIPEDCKDGDTIEVFVYKDSEDRIVATTLKPKAVLGDFAFLKVKTVTQHGAFLDWGLEKDLFVHRNEQKSEMRQGQAYIVYLYLDEFTQRIAATEKIGKYIQNQDLDVDVGDEVNILVFSKTELGFNVIINNRFKGLLYNNEIFRDIQVGDRLSAWVKNIREDDKIDVSLQKQGVENIEINARRVLEVLKQNNGMLELSDNSDPQKIYSLLGMSKKTFKKAIGSLYKWHLIEIGKDNISLV